MSHHVLISHVLHAVAHPCKGSISEGRQILTAPACILINLLESALQMHAEIMASQQPKS